MSKLNAFKIIVTRRLPSTAVDALAESSDDVPVLLLVSICIAGTLLILVNGAIVACYMQRKKKRQTQGNMSMHFFNYYNYIYCVHLKHRTKIIIIIIIK